MKRKIFLQSSAAIIGSTLLPSLSFAANPKKRSIRFAHISDIHVKPGAIPEAGMAKALQHVQSLDKKVDFIINGGDSIMDALEADKQKTQAQWDIFRSILKKENGLPIYHTIGNHDIWGWFVKENKPVDDRQYGKVWVSELLELKNTYYSFTKDNWHFIILDSTQLNPAGGYIAQIDAPQMAWLEQELANTPPTTHICIASHIPILSVCSGLFFDKTEANGDRTIKRNLMHSDFITLKNLFLKYPNIKTCISGHIHQWDEVDYLGIKYYCNGAVSGNWWKGSFHEFEPAYAVMEFYEDGTTKRTMMKYE